MSVCPMETVSQAGNEEPTRQRSEWIYRSLEVFPRTHHTSQRVPSPTQLHSYQLIFCSKLQIVLLPYYNCIEKGIFRATCSKIKTERHLAFRTVEFYQLSEM